MNSPTTVDGRPGPVQGVRPAPERTSLARLRGDGSPALRHSLRRVLPQSGSVPVAAFTSSI